jgi:hypothetical protein
VERVPAPQNKRARDEAPGDELVMEAAEFFSDPMSINRHKLITVMQNCYGTVDEVKVPKMVVSILGAAIPCHMHTNVRDALQTATDRLAVAERESLTEAIQEAIQEGGMLPDGSIRLTNGKRWWDLVERLAQTQLRAEVCLAVEKEAQLNLRDPSHYSGMETLWKYWVQNTPDPAAHRGEQRNQRTTRAKGTSESTCYRCGEKGHMKRTCREPEDVVCTKCSNKGHLAKACKRPVKREEADDQHQKCFLMVPPF